MVPKVKYAFVVMNGSFGTSLFNMVPKGRPATFKDIKGFKTNLVYMVPKNYNIKENIS